MRSEQDLFFGLQRPIYPTLYAGLVKRDESRKLFAGLACHKSESGVVEANSSEVRLLLVETLETVRLGFLSSSSGVRHGVIDFKAPDLEALHALISALGTAVDELRPPSLSWAPRGFGFLDSEGNRLAAFSCATDRRG